MLTLEQIQKRLQDRNLSYIARKIGVTSAYLSYIRSGKRANPTLEMMQKISAYLEAADNDQ